jgi:hypothetical protein
MDQLLNSLIVFFLILFGLGALLLMVRLAFKPLVRVSEAFNAHVAKQDANETNVTEVIGLLKTQITAIDDRELKAGERMETFIAHWKTSDQQYRQLFHEIKAANIIGKEQCRLHKMENELQSRTIKEHERRIGTLEIDMVSVKQKIG